MRVTFTVIFCAIIIACNYRSTNSSSDFLSIDSINANVLSDSSSEDFASFFNKFKSDSIFQQQRIDNPLTLIVSDEDTEEEQLQVIQYVSFNQDDWNIKIQYKTYEVSHDTMNVILQGIDTGVHIEHLFVKRVNQWHLFKIKNHST